MPPGPTVTADASGSWGCGAYCALPLVHWFQIQWPTSWKDTHIAAKELLPLVISSAIWGHHWRGSCVRFVSAQVRLPSQPQSSPNSWRYGPPSSPPAMAMQPDYYGLPLV